MDAAEGNLDSVAILFALRRESSFFLRSLPHPRKVPSAPCAAWVVRLGSARIVVVETGVGAGRTMKALDWLLAGPIVAGQPFVPRALVSAGFGGALDAGLKVGDVVQAREAVDERGSFWPLPWGPPLEVPSVRLLTMTRMVAGAEEKAALATKHAAAVVDMESAHVARIAAERHLPLLCLRAISDDARTSLAPYLVDLLSAGRVAPGRLLLALLRRPWHVPELWRLGRATRLAARNLAGVLRRACATGALRCER